MEKTKTCRRCSLVLPLSFFWKKADSRDGFHAACKSCNAPMKLAYSAAHREETTARARAWYAKNKQRAKASVAVWASNNVEKVRSIKTGHYKRNAIEIKARSAEWGRAHPEYMNYRTALQRARRLQATPVWANDFFIREIYDLCRRRNELKSCGVRWHVDHIVPLKSPIVCGLHVENNLRVIPAAENIAKSNKFGELRC